MNSKDRVSLSLKGKKPDKVPWVEIEFNSNIAAQITGKEFLVPIGHISEDYELFRQAVRQWIKLAKQINLDALGMFAWSPVFTEYSQSSTGRVMETKGLVKSIKDLEKISKSVPLPNKKPHHYNCAKIFIEEMKKAKLSTFFTASFPLDVTIRSTGFERFCLSLYDNLSLVEAVLDWFANYAVANFRYLSTLSPDFIWVADDIAYKSGPFIRPYLFRKLITPRYRILAREIKCPWIYHSDGNLLPIIDDLISLGMSALHPIQPKAMNIFQVKRDYGKKIALVGNIDIDLLAEGGSEDVKEEVDRLVSELGKEGGYLLSSGNCIVDYVNPENVVILGKRNK